MVRAGTSHFAIGSIGMKRLGHVFERITAFDNRWGAWRAFRRGKTRRPPVARFDVDADRHLLTLRRELLAGAYRPGPFRLAFLREPKKRLIAAAPVRDRVVHHAVHRVLAPTLDRGLIDHTYACLEGRGSHRAQLKFLRALRQYRYVLMLDVRHYFLSIDRAILMELMERRIKDRAALALLRRVAASGDSLYQAPGVIAFLELPAGFPPEGCGLPIGNLTSQWWGNQYLSGLDHFAKRELHMPHAQRYLDDVALFSDSRAQLVEARAATAEWLARERHLVWKHPDAPVRGTNGRFVYLGHLISRGGIEPRPEAWRRFRTRVARLVAQGRTGEVERSIASFRGVLGLSGVDRR